MHAYDHRTNVLLDQHLSAKLGDFGCAREISHIIGRRSVITTAVVARSLGYSPPEMDMCRISPKSDVYSYGVVSNMATNIQQVLCIYSVLC